MEQKEYVSGKRYADLMKTMWFTFFYSPAIPLGTLWSILGVIIYYWADKYNLVKRYIVKESISKDLTFEMIELLELVVMLHSFGNFFFKLKLFKFYEHSSIILLVIGGLYNLLPMQSINEFLFEMKS